MYCKKKNLCTGLPVYHALIMGYYTDLSCWSMSSLYGAARLSCVDNHCFRLLGHIRLPVYHVSIMGDCTVLGRWAMSSLYGTARLSCVDYG